MPEANTTHFKIAGIIVAVIAALISILVYISFGYLDYYNLGFKLQKSTSRVFTDQVYTGGRYLIGPDFTFKIYPASAQSVELHGVTVFSSDRLEVYIDAKFHYFIRPEQLHFLHQKYQLTYHSVIKSSAVDALKAASTLYSTENFIRNRTIIERGMELAVRKRIGGKCCENDCKLYNCLPDCIPMNLCKEKDMGLMINMQYFYLTKVNMPTKVYNRYLRALLLVEESQMEKYRLEEAVVKKEVDEAVKSIDNQAREVGENATAQAKLITQRANAESLKIVGSMRSEGLGILMNETGISDEKKKMSIYYLSSLGNNDRAHMAVDFNNFVVGGK